MKNIAAVFMVTVILVGTLLLAFDIRPVKASGTIYIRADGSVEGTDKIVSADNITYTFTDNISDSIVIERSDIVIDGADHTLQGTGSGSGFNCSGINNLTIRNTNIQNFTYGIILVSSSYNSISGDNITNNGYGIRLSSSSSSSISGNNITNNGIGIDLGSSSSNSISGNNMTNNHYGIRLGSSSNYSSISGNNITNSHYGIYLSYSSNYNNISENNIVDSYYYGIYFYRTSNNRVSGNNIYNIEPPSATSHGIYIRESSNNNITQNDMGGPYMMDVYHIFLSDSNNNSIAANTIRYCVWYGINLEHSSNNSIAGNTMIQNAAGAVRLINSCNNTISRNTMTKGGGVYLTDNSINNTISGNTMTNLQYGVYLGSSACYNNISENSITASSIYGIWLQGPNDNNNSIHHNNFIDNTKQVYGPGLNTWDNGYPSGGNYWSDYAGSDIESGPEQSLPGSDGIGDIRYIVDADNRDRYPLMNPYGSLQPPAYTLAITTTANGTANPTAGNYTYSQGQSVPVQGIPDTGYKLDHWKLDGLNVGSANPYSVLMDNNHTLHAVFALITYTLTITVTAGGTTDPSPGIYTYVAGSTPQVTATSSTDYLFDHWELDGNSVGAANPIIVTMDTNHTLQAVFMRHDIAVTNVALSKTVVGQGNTMHINVTVANQGSYTETFNVTVFAGTTAIETREVTLTSGDSIIVTFTWVTTGFAKGNYTLSAVADTVPDEVETGDNTLVDGWAFITIPGDVDGDRDVDIFDIVRMAGVYGIHIPPPDLRYNPQCDIDGDGDIDIFDLVIAAMNYGKSW